MPFVSLQMFTGMVMSEKDKLEKKRSTKLVKSEILTWWFWDPVAVGEFEVRVASEEVGIGVNGKGDALLASVFGEN